METIKEVIDCRYLEDENYPYDWMLLTETVSELSNRDIMKVEYGFVTDFISAPRWLWSIVGPIGHQNMASVIHDYIYTNHNYSRQFADRELLFHLNRKSPETPILNKLMFFGVRLFGAKRWNEFHHPKIK